MAINPMKLLGLKERLDIFSREHPNVPAFLSGAASYVKKDSVVELRITTPEGKKAAVNFQVTDDDLESLRQIMSLRG